MFIALLLLLSLSIALALKAAIALLGLPFVPSAGRGAGLGWAAAVSVGMLSMLLVGGVVGLHFVRPSLGLDALPLSVWVLLLAVGHGLVLGRLGRAANGERLGPVWGLVGAALAWALLGLVWLALGVGVQLGLKWR